MIERINKNSSSFIHVLMQCKGYPFLKILFLGLRDQELSISAQLKSLTEKWQIEKAALQEELLHLRNELNEAGVKARKFQQEAKVASTKSERLAFSMYFLPQ